MRFNFIADLVLACGIMCVVIAVQAWRRRTTNAAQSFMFLMASMTVYVLGYFLELTSLDLRAMLFWNKIQYIGILTFPTLYMIFSAQYSGHEKWLTRRNIPLVFVVPVILLVVKFFDDQLHLIYLSAQIDTSGLIPLLFFEHGPLYAVVAGYNLLVVTIGNYLLIEKRHFASSLYRAQTNLVLAGGIVVYLVYIFYLSGITIIPGLKHLDWNPLVYTIWGSAISLAIFRYRLFDLTPIARDALIEMLSDGVVVLDAQSRIVDANPEAQHIFGWQKIPVGRCVGDLMQQWINPEFLESVEGPSKIETHQTNHGKPVYYELTVSSLKDKLNQRIGSLILIHDISERVEIEKELQELSLVDDLTGLSNRRGFNMLASQLLNMANRMELNAGLYYVDLDCLKVINDRWGHATGDEALKDTAAILKSSFRASDLIARIGGDEFVILAIESPEQQGDTVLKRLQETLDRHNRQSDQKYEVSFSVGRACYQWDQPQSMETLLESADQAMYQCKQAKKRQLETIEDIGK